MFLWSYKEDRTTRKEGRKEDSQKSCSHRLTETSEIQSLHRHYLIFCSNPSREQGKNYSCRRSWALCLVHHSKAGAQIQIWGFLSPMILPTMGFKNRLYPQHAPLSLNSPQAPAALRHWSIQGPICTGQKGQVQMICEQLPIKDRLELEKKPPIAPLLPRPLGGTTMGSRGSQ